MFDQQPLEPTKRFPTLTARGVVLCLALIIFSVQFLYPWNDLSWQRFYRSFGTGILLLSVLWVVLSNHWLMDQFNSDSDEPEQLRDVRWTRNFVLAFIVGGAVVLLAYSLQFLLPQKGDGREVLSVFGAGALLALASLMTGALVGFVFGIPRSLRERPSPPRQPNPAPASPTQSTTASAPASAPTGTATDNTAAGNQFQSNTNLEEISDWLTKIIVGLGLTKLTKIPDYVGRLTWFVTHSIVAGHPEYTESVAFSIMAAFGCCGFFMGYLMTRLFLQRAFSLAAVATPADQMRSEVKGAALDPVSLDAVPDAATVDAGIKRALSVQSVSSNVSAASLRIQISALAKQYEALRLALASGDERTKSMEQVASQMKSLALAAQPLLDDLKKSNSSGERLAAVTFLEIKPQEGSLDWLVDRIVTERPFIGYHAALALLAATRAFAPASNDATDPAHPPITPDQKGPHTHLCEALKKAMKSVEDRGLTDSDRYKVLLSAKAESKC
jgi:hypothetical protein